MMRFYFLMIMCLAQLSCSHSVESKSHNNMLDKLQSRYDSWQGVNHKIGGLSREGVDCSGFVQLTYSEEFNIPLPRTTNKQSQMGTSIKKEHLKAGDLVFFKIPKQGKMYHVGIYLENIFFLHASTSAGVTVSNLNYSYWAKNYWKAQRVK